MKRTMVLLTVLILGITLFAGCGKKSGDSGSGGSSASSGSSAGDSAPVSVDTGGLSGKYYEWDVYEDKPKKNYIEFNSNGTCGLYSSSADFTMEGKFSVNGNTIVFASGAEFDTDGKATFEGDKITWDRGYGDPDIYVKQ